MNKYLLSALLMISAGVTTGSFAKITLINKTKDNIYVRFDKTKESSDSEVNSTIILEIPVNPPAVFYPMFKDKERVKEASSINAYIDPGVWMIPVKKVEFQNNKTYEISSNENKSAWSVLEK